MDSAEKVTTVLGCSSCNLLSHLPHDLSKSGKLSLSDARYKREASGGWAGWPTVRKPEHVQRKLADGYLIKALERIGIFADQQYQGGGLRVGFGSTLFPFLESSFVDPQLAGEDGSEQLNFLRVSRISFELEKTKRGCPISRDFREVGSRTAESGVV